jgi:hypothetical protein
MPHAAVAALFLLPATGAAPGTTAFQGAHQPIPAEIAATMKEHSWREGCPLPLERLSYLTVDHWGFDHRVHRGELIVDTEIATEVLEIFRELFGARFPIEKMHLIDVYGGSDDESMADNNTSAFNCRWVTGHRGVFSQHSYGRAIDINPRINPYVSNKSVKPAAGQQYVDRTQTVPGIILAGDVVVTAFKSRGWIWGGGWKSIKDYQHFEKRRATRN